MLQDLGRLILRDTVEIPTALSKLAQMRASHTQVNVGITGCAKSLVVSGEKFEPTMHTIGFMHLSDCMTCMLSRDECEPTNHLFCAPQ